MKTRSPDQALLCEIKEEVGIDAETLNQSDMPLGGNAKINLAMPFYINVHSVGDHDHCCLYYICKAINPEQLQINKELKNFTRFTKDDLDENHVSINVKN